MSCGAVEQRRNEGDLSEVFIGLDENKSCFIDTAVNKNTKIHVV